MSLKSAATKKTIWKNIITLAILGIAVHLILPQIVTLRNSFHVLAAMRYWAVGCAFIAQAISYLGLGFLEQKTLGLFKQTPTLFRSILILMGSVSIQMAGGGVVGGSAAVFKWTNGEKRRIGGAALATLFPSLFTTTTLLVLSVFGLIHLIISQDLVKAQMIGFSAALGLLALVICLCLLATHYQDRAEKVVFWVARKLAAIRHRPFDPIPVQEEIDGIFAAWDELWEKKWRILVLSSFFNVTFDIMTLYFMFIAAGINISFDTLLAGYALPLLLGRMVVILPGGVGVVESGMAALYTVLGIPNAEAVIVVLGYRLISFWIPIISGFPIAAYLHNTIDQSNHKSADQVLK